MAGWNAYVDTQLVATGAVAAAGIFGRADMQLYANANNLQMSAYKAKVTNEDGSEGEADINEAAIWLAYGQGQRPSNGFRLGGEKYQVLREAEGPTIYLKKSTGGACVSYTNTLMIVGVRDDKANESSSLAACNKAVEDLAEYLRSAGF